MPLKLTEGLTPEQESQLREIIGDKDSNFWRAVKVGDDDPPRFIVYKCVWLTWYGTFEEVLDLFRKYYAPPPGGAE